MADLDQRQGAGGRRLCTGGRREHGDVPALLLELYADARGAGLLNRLAMIFNTIVAYQDRRVLVTQRPGRSDLRTGEKLIPGDSPIIAYRRRRQELIDAADA